MIKSKVCGGRALRMVVRMIVAVGELFSNTMRTEGVAAWSVDGGAGFASEQKEVGV